MYRLEIDEQEATLEGGKWTCPDAKSLEDLLNTMAETVRPGPHLPQAGVEPTIVSLVLEEFGDRAKVIAHTPDHEPGVNPTPPGTVH